MFINAFETMLFKDTLNLFKFFLNNSNFVQNSKILFLNLQILFFKLLNLLHPHLNLHLDSLNFLQKLQKVNILIICPILFPWNYHLSISIYFLLHKLISFRASLNFFDNFLNFHNNSFLRMTNLLYFLLQFFNLFFHFLQYFFILQNFLLCLNNISILNLWHWFHSTFWQTSKRILHSIIPYNHIGIFIQFPQKTMQKLRLFFNLFKCHQIIHIFETFFHGWLFQGFYVRSFSMCIFLNSLWTKRVFFLFVVLRGFSLIIGRLTNVLNILIDFFIEKLNVWQICF